MTIFNMQHGVSVSGMPAIHALAGIAAAHRAGWAPAAPQHKRRAADETAASVNRGTT